MSTSLTVENRAKLTRVSAATLTTVLFRRGLRNTCVQGVSLLNPSAARMVGEAYTLRYIPAREDLDHLRVFESPDHPQRRAIEHIPQGHVLVIDARGDRRAATAGAILITRLMVRGAAGVVTDGCLRDTPDIAKLMFPVYAVGASPPTNLTRHHAIDLDLPVACGEVAVYPADIVVGDAEGVVIIPSAIANEVTEEATEMTAFEDWAEREVRGGRPLPGLYPPSEATRAEYAAWKVTQRK